MAAKKHARVTAEELAAACNVTPRTVTRHEHRGTIARGPDGLFDVTVASAAIRAAPAGGRPRKAAPSDDGVSQVNWAEVLKREQAKKARLERMELQGRLVLRSAVEAMYAEAATLARDQLMQLGPRLAGRLAAESDPRECSRIVSDEVTLALRSLASDGQQP